MPEGGRRSCRRPHNGVAPDPLERDLLGCVEGLSPVEYANPRLSPRQNGNNPA
jgi:hypothetical protein